MDFSELKKIVNSSFDDYFANKIYFPPEQNPDFENENSRGIAVRLKNNYRDRGCLSLYCGIKDFQKAASFCCQQACDDPRYEKISQSDKDELYVNICVFENWAKMKNCYDFIPGYDSLLLINKNASNSDDEITLLQTSIAIENNYSRDQFLRRLCLKANLPPDSYKTENFVFYKAPTQSFTEKLN